MMATVADILDAAKNLRSDQLDVLRAAIDKLARNTRALTITVNKVEHRLMRLDEAEFRALLGRSLAIEEDYWFLIQLVYSARAAGEELTFAQVYLILKELTGESSRFFDDYKGSFSFPFRLDIRKANRRLDYLLEIRNHRDSLYFHIRKVVASDDKRLRNHAIHPPFTEEWSKEEINSFIAYLHGYFSGYWSVRGKGSHEPFVHAIPSSLIVYGFCDGEIFARVCGSREEWEVARKYHEEKIQQHGTAIQADPCMIHDAKPEDSP